VELDTLTEMKCPEKTIPRGGPGLGKFRDYVEMAVKPNEAIKNLGGNRGSIQINELSRIYAGGIICQRPSIRTPDGRLSHHLQRRLAWSLSFIPLATA